MSEYITVVIHYKNGAKQPKFGAGMEVLGGAVESVQFDHALNVIEQLENQNELLERQCNDLLPEVAEINLRKNCADIKMEGGLLNVFANQFVDTFNESGAQNHLEMTFYHKSTKEKYTVLMQKCSGLTQGEKNEVLQNELSETKKLLEDALQREAKLEAALKANSAHEKRALSTTQQSEE